MFKLCQLRIGPDKTGKNPVSRHGFGIRTATLFPMVLKKQRIREIIWFKSSSATYIVFRLIQSPKMIEALSHRSRPQSRFCPYTSIGWDTCSDTLAIDSKSITVAPLRPVIGMRYRPQGTLFSPSQTDGLSLSSHCSAKPFLNRVGSWT